MIAKFGTANWGWGPLCASPSGVARGAQGGGNDPADQLAAMGAADAVAELSGNFAEDMPDVNANYFPGPMAEALYWSDADILGIQGPVGSGKTTTTLRSRLRRAMAMPRSTIDLDEQGRGWRRYKLLVVRETYRQLWSTTIPSYLETFPKTHGSWSGGRGDPVTHVIIYDDGNGPIEFRVEFMAFGDDITASMRGIQTTDMWLNEADTVPGDVITTGVGRINRWPGLSHFAGYPPELQGYGQIICDFNAPDEDNWTFRVFHDEVEQSAILQKINGALPAGGRAIAIEFYNQPGYGQPGCENLSMLAANYYPLQIALMTAEGRGDKIDRLVYNKIVYLRAGEPVFKREFNRRIHVAESTIKPEPGVPLRLGLDQGFKGAAVIAQFLPPFHWRFLAEMHFPQERLMAVVFGERLRDLLETPRFAGCTVEGGWGDMAGEHGASQAADENATWNKLVGQVAGFRVRPQKIGTNRIQPRLEALRAPLEFMHAGQPGLLIDPSCRFLIRGFEARYVWKDEIDANGDKRKIPDKSLTEANVMDASQYLALSEHKLNGTSPISSPSGRSALMGHNGGPRMGAPVPAGGLSTSYDVMNPNGG